MRGNTRRKRHFFSFSGLRPRSRELVLVRFVGIGAKLKMRKAGEVETCANTGARGLEIVLSSAYRSRDAQIKPSKFHEPFAQERAEPRAHALRFLTRPLESSLHY